MDTIAARVGQQYPEVKDWGINLVTFTDTFVSSSCGARSWCCSAPWRSCC